MGRKRKVQDPEADLIPPEVRNSANERERDRMRVLSKAFVKLKTTLPWVPPDTKLSKLDTLRLATCYIAHLRQILDEDETEDTSHSSERRSSDNNNSSSNSGFTHPINLTWPFSFQGKPPINGSSSPPPLCQPESTQQIKHEQIIAS